MIESGERIEGRYQIQEQVGSGGMADVYLAYDLELQRDVAIKVLARHLADDPEFQERLWHEATNAAALRHPNIVAIYDRGIWNDRPYISMEYVPGLSLKGQVRTRGGTDLHWAVSTTIQILRAVDCAHHHGVIHRDLKPHNILIDEDGCVKVTDFGIARAGASQITEAGSVMGSAHYIAPEQAQGQELTPAADLYAVGVILYELLTGELPFDGENAVAIALQHVAHEPTPPSELNGSITAEFDAVVLKALAKDPTQRFQSASQFITALCLAAGIENDEALHGQVVRNEALAQKRSRKQRPWWLWWVVGGLTLFAVVVVIMIALATSRTKLTIVPNITGASSAAALARLDNEDFSVEVRRVGSTLPRDTVIRQKPFPGEQVSVGTKVILTVSDGPGTKAVPDISGKQEKDATKLLRVAGFQPVVKRQADTKIRKGFVVETRPPVASQAQLGGRITLVISTGPELVEIPNLIGSSQAEAQARLRKLGLIPEITERSVPATATPGVTEQYPEPGKRVSTATIVKITVTMVEQKTNTILLPNLVGQPATQAKSLLEGLGLSVFIDAIRVDQSNRNGIVQRQQPSAGTQVTEDTKVVLVVGVFTG